LQQTTNLAGASWQDAGEPTTETTGRRAADRHEHVFPGEKYSESLMLKIYLQSSL
jgi:hypothetical protein